ncbi:MAG TPA: DUF899 family protein [Solirubrobacteraceae bacterium]|jgi:predicted dithiol-disulfide oxidoreductase (DUF899 family)|nr:DUF899 family protein [Solirubrobacteraceae bacterium]
MTEHEIGSREEWQAALNELAKLEAEQADLNEKIKEKRLALPRPRLRQRRVFAWTDDADAGNRSLVDVRIDGMKARRHRPY